MICTKLIEEDNILLQVARGDLLLSDLVAAVDRRVRHPKYDAHRPILWDVSEADWSGAHQEFGFVAEEIGIWIKARKPLGPVALVFGSATDEALFNAFYAPSKWMNFRTFTDSCVARDWLLTQPSPAR